MMMDQKHLHELLKEDQEPFHLKDYISEKRCQFKRPSLRNTLQPNKRKPIIERSTTKRNLCKQACFFSFHESPDRQKSPLPDFLTSVSKSPCKNPNGAVYLHIPAKTGALLLEAAMRIQKQSSSSKPKTQMRNSGFGIFGSILKRLKDRNMTRKRALCAKEDNISRPVDSSVSRGNFSGRKCIAMEESVVGVNNKIVYSEMAFSACSCNNSRLSSAGWSESNEEKSLDLGTSTSCRSDVSEDMEFMAKQRENGGFVSCQKHFHSSPSSQFTLQKSSSSCRTTDYCAPATSPSRHNKEGKENYKAESLQNIHLEGEEAEQCSPVSVLDPPFEDDDNEVEHVVENEEDYDLERSYAIVQRARQELLQKLRRFEKLAELDPIELEKRMSEEQDNEGEDDYQELEDEERHGDDDKLIPLHRQNNVDEFSADMKRLVLDLIAGERREHDGSDDNEMVMKNVCKRLDSWGEVESNTIGMVVELDFRSGFGEWNKHEEQVAEMAKEIDVSIFELLVEEFSEDLVY